jgi:long-subunit fatty acid transport protein
MVASTQDASTVFWNPAGISQQLATDGPRAGQVVSDTALKFSDSWRAGLELEYQINTPWLLRAGVAYDRSPVEDPFRTPTSCTVGNCACNGRAGGNGN